MARHHSIRNPRPRTVSLPDVRLLDDVVHPKILEALRTASEQLTAIGVPHAVAGALAVGAYGYPRNTKDVDFLVGDEAFKFHGGGLVTIAQGVPVAVGSVAVDPMSIGPNEDFLHEAIHQAIVSDGLPILPVEALFVLKLKSPRAKDAADLVELLKVGAPRPRIHEYVARHTPQLVAKLEELFDRAEEES